MCSKLDGARKGNSDILEIFINSINAIVKNRVRGYALALVIFLLVH